MRPNQNANAIRFATMYNFRFDADQAPNPTNATVGFFKTGSLSGVIMQAWTIRTSVANTYTHSNRDGHGYTYGYSNRHSNS